MYNLCVVLRKKDKLLRCSSKVYSGYYERKWNKINT